MTTDAGLVPVWDAPVQVRARMSVRNGPGASSPPWDRFNLGDHVGDDPLAVAQSRTAWADVLGVPPVFIRQVHGTAVTWLGPQHPTPSPPVEADASLTMQRRLACTVLVADCLPVLLARRDGRAVAAAHAGWRGLAGAGGVGILERTVTALRGAGAATGNAAERLSDDVVAWLGPCIGPGAFEVGDDVRQAFEGAGAASAFQPVSGRPGKWWCDLPALARFRLERLGVRSVSGNDGTPSWCTVTQPSRFFSHRRDAGLRGSTGRMAASIWLDA